MIENGHQKQAEVKNPGTEIGSRVLYVGYGLNVWRTEERDVPL